MSRPPGLDPAIAVELMGGLRRLADAGSTVVLTTHSLQDLGHCDRIVFLTHGCLAFAGTPEEAQSYFEVESLEKVYQRLATEGTAADWATRFRQREVIAATTQTPSQAPPEARHRVGLVRQLTVLTRRTLDTIVRNRLTLAILLGSPLLVVAMFAVLFRPGAFAFEDPSPSAIVMILYWVSFAGFFGLTYGLLQICTEMAIVQRERLVGLRLGPYVLSKLAVLTPFLLAIVVLMLAVLRAPGPPASGRSHHVSLHRRDAAARRPAAPSWPAHLRGSREPLASDARAPMLCFPAVLFSGRSSP